LVTSSGTPISGPEDIKGVASLTTGAGSSYELKFVIQLKLVQLLIRNEV
jgi:hypothetical protein